MASTRNTFSVDSELLELARRLDINVSAAARRGVEEAVRRALAEADRSAYLRLPETDERSWEDAEGWAEP